LTQGAKLTDFGAVPRVLVAPLDWGLGHATRCISIIRVLLEAGCEVVIACYGAQKKLLQGEFPALHFLDLRGYGVRYSTKKGLTFLKIIFQAPKILIQINRENRWLKAVLQKERFDAVISDNRYGLYSPKVCTVFITHQLHIPTGLGQVLGKKLSAVAGHYINRFSFCWIPDTSGNDSLAGRLSAPSNFTHIPCRYIGILSRMKKTAGSGKKWELLVMLSGPEPQRTLFEKKILGQLEFFPTPVLLLRGLPGETGLPAVDPHIHIMNHLSGAALNEVLCSSELVICRAGYTSIMELMLLGKKCILVPTPGQPEQEYLASYLSGKKLAYTIDQKDFILSAVLAAARDYPFASYPQQTDDALQNAVDELMEAIRRTRRAINQGGWI
jgi:hypothetical protein